MLTKALRSCKKDKSKSKRKSCEKEAKNKYAPKPKPKAKEVEVLMSKRFYAAFVPLLAVAAFAAMPATSQAAFHWYACLKHAGDRRKILRF